MKKIIYSLTLSLLVFATGCEDSLLDLSNPGQLGTADFIVDDTTADQAVVGIYSAFQNTNIGGAVPIQVSGLYADELTHTGSFPTYTEYNVNNISATGNTNNTNIWGSFYAGIFRANSVISALDALVEGEVSDAVKSASIAEARALRAYFYFFLVQAYGGVPIPEGLVTQEGSAAGNVARSSESAVYAYIQADIDAALGNLADNGLYRFSNDAARVLKAKVHMAMGEYAAAQTALEPLIGSYTLVDDYADLFVPGANTEAIFKLNYSTDDSNALAFYFYPSAEGGRRETAPSASLVESFEAGDARLGLIRDPEDETARILTKYSDVSTGTDQPNIYRYADVLLMYAELLARSNDPTASTYINEVRSRANVGDVALTSGNFVDLIGQERLLELYGEGQRWFDVKRLGLAQEVIESKGISYNDNRLLWPIPQTEINANESITQADQNPGY
ncbi:RagB/SusD family nutrient uptake outer membrane protein [Allomuricauda sp. NBRC 101325]|uniref:RagB/SusD family nutrient uptake outer membrane protein n=1 Tax=Allomuricauda sp. NBRC 101325 TaxID=1113758 RepID=UPI002553251E|nr:RagB/SusD family nutrient uptake outer membrane protein [Muricauda sp. NBRC 101325]